jgi:S1-C subfamily serine protease
MTGIHRSLVFAAVAAGGIWLAGCDSRPPISFTPDAELTTAPEPAAPSNAIKYPRPPESLAEMNPYGLHYLRDGTSVKLNDRNPELDATAFGRKALGVQEENTAQLGGLPKWRKLVATEIYDFAQRYEFAEKQSDKVLRYKLLSMAARMGHGEAQASLSNCYSWGDGASKDFKKAFYWAQQSSKNGCGRGSGILSYYYRDGVGVAKNQANARSFLILAANRGHVQSQASLGYELLFGEAAQRSIGLKADPITARKWLMMAAAYPLTELTTRGRRLGKMEALCALGLMHDNGRGVPRSETEALAYYYLARSIGDKDEAGNIDANIALRERNMSSSARQYSQMRAQELRPLYFDAPVTTRAEPADKPSVGFGSGVFVTKTGHILTAAHVIENASKVTARVVESSVEAEILAVDYPNDVALLKVDAEVDAAPVRSSTGVELGNQVFTIGFPNMLLQGTKPKFTEGTISSTSGMRDDPRQFQVSVQVQPGNSGGALFDENGNVVGLVVSRLDDEATTKLTGSAPQNVNYAVKSSYALPLIESLKAELLAEQRPSWFRRPDRQEVVGNAKKASVPLVVELRPEW